MNASTEKETGYFHTMRKRDPYGYWLRKLNADELARHMSSLNAEQLAWHCMYFMNLVKDAQVGPGDGELLDPFRDVPVVTEDDRDERAPFPGGL